MTTNLTASHELELIDLAYRAVLRRPPDPDGIASYRQFLQHQTFADLILALRNSEEFKLSYAADFDSYELAADSALQQHVTPEIERLNSLLKVPPASLDEATFRSISQRSMEQFRASHSQNFSSIMAEYLEYHHKRFHLINGMVYTLLEQMGSPAPKVLDFGYTVNTLILANVLPHAGIHVCDQHQATEVNKDFDAGSWIRDRFFTLNLERERLEDRDLGSRFDIIIFAEVLEHLVIHPVNVFRFLIKHLAPGGRILLTTPNFYREEVLRAIAARRRFAVYPKEYTFEDHNHFHFMEYAMGDLLSFVREAGGRLHSFFFSDSIFTPSADVPEDRLGNLIITFGR